MKIQDSIRLCMRDYEAKEYESAMLHACNAVDGMANELYDYGDDKKRFTDFVRKNYDIISAVSFPCSYFQKCEFPVRINGKDEKTLAQLIYVVHRCNHCHGNEIPVEFKLILDEEPDEKTLVEREVFGADIYSDFSYMNGALRINARIIPALVMAVVLQPVRWEKSNIRELNKCHIDCKAIGELSINEWWGRDRDFKKELEKVGFPKDFNRSAQIIRIGSDNKICAFESIHESEFPKY